MILTAATQTTSATKNFMVNSLRVLGDECARVRSGFRIKTESCNPTVTQFIIMLQHFVHVDEMVRSSYLSQYIA